MTTGRTVAHVHAANLVLAGILVVLTLSLRGSFCGWLCPLGAVQEGIHRVGEVVSNRIPRLRRARRRIGADGTRLARIDRIARWFKYAVLVWAIGGAAIAGYMVFRDYDPWAALITVVEFELTTATVVLLVVLTASFSSSGPSAAMPARSVRRSA